MTLEKLEEWARGVEQTGDSSDDTPGAQDAALAILLLVPVVKAAEALSDASLVTLCSLPKCLGCQLARAIDAYRAAQG